MSDGDTSSDNDDDIGGLPEMDGSSSDEDVFAFQKRKFQKRKTDYSDESSCSDDSEYDDDEATKPSSSKRQIKKKKGSPSVEERLSAMRRRKSPKLPTDDSDDSDTENDADVPKAPRPSVVELLSSDDDDDDVVVVQSQQSRYSSANPEQLTLIEQARSAARGLRQAQNYHAEDVRVTVEQPPNQPTNPMIATLGYQTLGATGYARKISPMMSNEVDLTSDVPQNGLNLAQANLGKSMKLSLRAEEYVNGKLQSSSYSNGEHNFFSIMEREPLRNLVEKYVTSRELPLDSTTVVLSFRGDQVDLNMTPSICEMQDGDVIDAVAKTIVVPTKSSKKVAKSAANLGEEIMLTLRVQEMKEGKRVPVDEVLKIRMLEKFSVLMEKFKKKRNTNSSNITMSFDGLTLDMNKTPTDYEVEDEDLIDVLVK